MNPITGGNSVWLEGPNYFLKCRITHVSERGRSGASGKEFKRSVG
jgi:hypothetical protein